MVVRDYLRHAKKYDGTGASSEWHRCKLAFKPIKELYAKTAAVEFGPGRFKAVRQKMIENGLSRTGINAPIRVITNLRCHS